jgi:acyl-coenzyme A thioesterase PaaI-like protein
MKTPEGGTFWDVPEDRPTGAWAEKRRLATALREVVALCVTTDAPASALSEFADAANALLERLRAWPRRTFREVFTSPEGFDLPTVADRGTMIGKCNPVAPPITVRVEGEMAVGSVTFGPPYEGAPGFVHGGMIAAAFDQVFGYVQVAHGIGSMTAELTVRYRRPTPLLTPLRLEARLERTEGRKSFVAGRLLDGERVLAEGSGLFVAIDAAKMQSLISGD